MIYRSLKPMARRRRWTRCRDDTSRVLDESRIGPPDERLLKTPCARAMSREQTSSAREQTGQDRRLVAHFVLSGVDQRHGLSVAELTQPDQLGVACDLFLVTLLELFEPFGPVAVPLAQLLARRQVLGPPVDGGSLLGHAARPEPVDENARAIVRCGVFIGSLDLQHVPRLVLRWAELRY